MENQLIRIYLFVRQVYDTCSETCFKRLSSNQEPDFTEQRANHDLVLCSFERQIAEKTNAQIYSQLLI